MSQWRWRGANTCSYSPFINNFAVLPFKKRAHFRLSENQPPQISFKVILWIANVLTVMYLARMVVISSRVIFFFTLSGWATYHFCSRSLPCRLNSSINNIVYVWKKNGFGNGLKSISRATDWYWQCSKWCYFHAEFEENREFSENFSKIVPFSCTSLGEYFFSFSLALTYRW